MEMFDVIPVSSLGFWGTIGSIIGSLFLIVVFAAITCRAGRLESPEKKDDFEDFEDRWTKEGESR